MKKYLLSFLIALVAIPLVFSGCNSINLKNAPTETAEMAIYGSALVYDDYVYFANSYFAYSSMPASEDKDYVYRIALDNSGANPGKITTNETTSLPTGLEKAVTKVAGSEYSFMFSDGAYIYFATPSTDIDSNTKEHHYEYNHYYRVNTDGTGLTRFYASTATISQQSVLTIGEVNYLVFVDSETIDVDGTDTTVNKLISINLNTLTTKVIAEDFTSAVFADRYLSAGDAFAYFIKDVDTEETTQIGNELYKVDLVNGGDAVQINSNQTRTIELLKVFNGDLYFSVKNIVGVQTELDPVYVVNDFTLTNTYAPVTIFAGDTTDIASFDVLLGEDNEEYYVFSLTSVETTYLLTRGTTELNGNELTSNKISILFSYGDYVYFTYEAADGIYRISVRGNKTIETITTVSDFKTTNISFDGQYIYYYATNSDLTTGETYYMHRSQVDRGVANCELLSFVPDDEIPEDEDAEE